MTKGFVRFIVLYKRERGAFSSRSSIEIKIEINSFDRVELFRAESTASHFVLVQFAFGLRKTNHLFRGERTLQTGQVTLVRQVFPADLFRRMAGRANGRGDVRLAVHVELRLFARRRRRRLETIELGFESFEGLLVDVQIAVGNEQIGQTGHFIEQMLFLLRLFFGRLARRRLRRRHFAR